MPRQKATIAVQSLPTVDYLCTSDGGRKLENGGRLKPIQPARGSAKRVLRILGRILLFFDFIDSRGRSDGRGGNGRLLQVCAADRACAVVIHEQLVGSCEVRFGCHHPSAEEVCGDQLILSFDGTLQPSGKGVQLFAKKVFHEFFLTNGNIETKRKEGRMEKGSRKRLAASKS
jgi:hypothetical protein